MKFNRLIPSLLVGAGLAFAAVQAQAQMVLKLAEIHVQGYPTELADEEFAKLVNKYTNGTLKVDVFPGGQITTDEKVAIEQVQIGAVAIARVSSGPLGAFNPQMNVFGLPYIFDSKDHMWAFLNGPYGQKMLSDLGTSRMIGLCWYDGGARSYYAKNPIKKFEDLKGLKVRTMANPLIMKMVESMGANPVPMSVGQIFSSLQTGVIDAAENNPPTLLSQNHYQIARNYLLTEHLRLPEVLFMSKMVWDRLNPAQQAAIRKAAVETVAFQRAKWDAFEVDALNKVKAAGVTVTEVKDFTPYRNAVKPLVDSEASKYTETLKAINEARPKK